MRNRTSDRPGLGAKPLFLSLALALGCGETHVRDDGARPHDAGAQPHDEVAHAADEVARPHDEVAPPPDEGGNMDRGEQPAHHGGIAGSSGTDPLAICYLPLDDCEGCPDYAPRETVCRDDNHWWQASYEGDCGDYRYRFQGGSFYGSVSYWERETGRLVTAYSYTDSNIACPQRVYGDRLVHEQCRIFYEHEVCLAAAADADAGIDDDGGV